MRVVGFGIVRERLPNEMVEMAMGVRCRRLPAVRLVRDIPRELWLKSFCCQIYKISTTMFCLDFTCRI